MVHQLVHAPHVFEEEGADLGYGGLQPVEVYLLARPLVPVIGAKADDVALVGHHVDDLVLLEEAPDGRVLLPVLLRVSMEMARGRLPSNCQLRMVWAIIGEPQ